MESLKNRRLYDEIANAIGKVCGEYAHVERIDDIFNALAFCISVACAKYGEEFDIVRFCQKLNLAYKRTKLKGGE